MKRNDEIQKLFDDYAKELAPREELSSKAHSAMIANGQSHSSRAKTSWTIHLAWIVPTFCILLVSLIAFGTVFANIFNDRKPGGNQQATDQLSPSVQSYTFADVKGRRVQLSDYYDGILNVSALGSDSGEVTSGFEIVDAHYYAFYTDGDQLRYIKALLGIRSADGTFTELTIIAEADGYVREDLADAYDRGYGKDGFVSDGGYDSSGEYVTQGFFSARGFHFYVVGRNGQRTDEVRKIIYEIM